MSQLCYSDGLLLVTAFLRIIFIATVRSWAFTLLGLVFWNGLLVQEVQIPPSQFCFRELEVEGKLFQHIKLAFLIYAF